MRVEFIGGKKAMRFFMPFVTAIKPSDFDISGDFPEEKTEEDLEVIEWHAALRFANPKTTDWTWTIRSMGEEMRLNRRMNTVKAILRWVSKQNFDKGTILIIDNWFVGYATLVITI